jgi:hypothetical protein
MNLTSNKGSTPKRGALDERTLARTEFASEDDGQPVNLANSDAGTDLLAAHETSMDVTSTGADADADSDRETAIREAAYRRYQARGGADSSQGSAMQDWMEAQAEIDGR